MVKHICPTCKKVFKKKSNLDDHLNRKKPCNPPEMVVQKDNGYDVLVKKIEMLTEKVNDAQFETNAKKIDLLEQKNKELEKNTKKLEKNTEKIKVLEKKVKELLIENKECKKNIKNMEKKLETINQSQTLSDNSSNDKPIKLTLKQKIPAPLKAAVWDEWIGEEVGKAKCMCCKKTDLTQGSFTCGHIVAESKGGNLTVNNLKPICQLCNSSMGNRNMDEFIKFCGFDKIVAKPLIK